MTTIFKKGMKVYDQFVFPNKEGRVLEIVEEDSYPIKVTLGDPKILWCYTKDGRHGARLEPSLATSPYSILGFEQKAPAHEFQDALDWLDNNKNYQTVFENERTYPSKEIYEAFEALRKLIILREYYNDGSTKANYSYSVYGSNILRFKTCEIRDRFKEEQEELLNIAKPLL